MSTSNVVSLEYASQQVTIYLGIPILILGVIGNIFNLIVFLSLKTFRESSCAFYLMIMSAVSLGQLLITFSGRIMVYGFNIDWASSSFFYCKFRMYFGTACAITAVACMCLAVIDQFLATCSKPQWQQWSNIKVAHRAILIFVSISFLHGIPFLIYYDHVKSSSTGRITCTSTNDMLTQYQSKFYTPVLIGYLPMFIDVIFGLLASYNVKSLAYRTIPLVRRELDKQLTTIVLMQTVFNFFTTNPYIITIILSSDTNFMRDSNNAEGIRLAIAVTMSIYFLNYANTDTQIITNDICEDQYQYFIHRDNACPIFCKGTSRNEYHPLIIYMHNVFCKDIFCSQLINDYLQENYIVWSWDMTYESNRNKFNQIGEDIFSKQFFIDFPVADCPMLIAIMPECLKRNDSCLAFTYDFKMLLKGDILMFTHQELSLDTLLDELIIFKEDFNKKKILSFNFVKTTCLSLEIILEIIKYLSLNDVINVFSIDILPLLWKYKIQLPIIEPSIHFMSTIIEKINRKQILSLYFKAVQLKSLMPLISYTTFDCVISLTLFNLQNASQLNGYKNYFSNLTRLSLCYDIKVDFYSLTRLFNQFQSPLKQLEIHCNSILCSHNRTSYFFSRVTKFNDTIKYFLLDITYGSMGSINNCVKNYDTCFLMITTDFITVMPNIEHVRLIINQESIEKLLDITEWICLADKCPRLKKVTLQIIRNILHNIILKEKILQFQEELYNMRKIIEFRIIL